MIPILQKIPETNSVGKCSFSCTFFFFVTVCCGLQFFCRNLATIRINSVNDSSILYLFLADAKM